MGIFRLGFALYGQYILGWCGLHVGAASICHILGTYKENICKIYAQTVGCIYVTYIFPFYKGCRKCKNRAGRCLLIVALRSGTNVLKPAKQPVARKRTTCELEYRYICSPHSPVCQFIHRVLRKLRLEKRANLYGKIHIICILLTHLQATCAYRRLGAQSSCEVSRAFAWNSRKNRE